jgi:hydroxymethylpyrimidine/phosphomethylpyrimidine kinase
MRSVLTIAGSDPTGGAGIPADLQVFRDFGFHGVSALTAAVDQDGRRVIAIRPTPPDQVGAACRRIIEIARPVAVKIGLLHSGATARAVAGCLEVLEPEIPVVLDPVLAAGNGDESLSERGLAKALGAALFDRVTVVTPNLPEAERLLERSIPHFEAAKTAALELSERGGLWVLLKGGHLPGAPADLLAHAGDVLTLVNEHHHDIDVHGTGCHLASAIACLLALGYTVPEAVQRARSYLQDCRRVTTRMSRAVIVHGATTARAARKAVVDVA